MLRLAASTNLTKSHSCLWLKQTGCGGKDLGKDATRFMMMRMMRQHWTEIGERTCWDFVERGDTWRSFLGVEFSCFIDKQYEIACNWEFTFVFPQSQNNEGRRVARRRVSFILQICCRQRQRQPFCPLRTLSMMGPPCTMSTERS
jgi:hypothetical protein